MTFSDILGDFTIGCAGLLVTAGVGVYRPAGPAYNVDTEIGITTALIMPDGPLVPARMIVVTSYLIGNSRVRLPISRIGLNIRIRGMADPSNAKCESAVTSGVYQTFEDLCHVTVGSVHIDTMRSISAAPMGVDTKGRSETILTFNATADVPATANRNLSF